MEKLVLWYYGMIAAWVIGIAAVLVFLGICIAHGGFTVTWVR
jgi:hypothetical protein